MQKKNSIFGILLLSMVILYSCNQNTASENSSMSSDQEGLSSSLPEGFMEFYDNFHTDSLFQMEHVVFPLKAKTIQIDSTGSSTYETIYSVDNWKIHKPFQNDDSYTRTHMVLGNIVIEKIQDNMGLLEIERRWGVIDSTWNLIFYQTTEKQW